MFKTAPDKIQQDAEGRNIQIGVVAVACIQVRIGLGGTDQRSFLVVMHRELIVVIRCSGHFKNAGKPEIDIECQVVEFGCELLAK